MTLPKRAAKREADAAVRELAPWIERRRRALARAAAEVARTPGTVPYLGGELTLSAEARTRVHRRGDELLVPRDDHRGAGALVPADGAHRDRPAARRRDRPRRRPYSKLTIRGQKTRWASCSQTGAMSFNWRLLLAPEPVLDYVVEHEVCHLEVHGPLAALLAAARVARAGLARPRPLAAPLRLDAGALKRPSQGVVRRSRRPPARPAGGAAGPSTPAPSRRRGRRTPRAARARAARLARRPAARA